MITELRRNMWVCFGLLALCGLGLLVGKFVPRKKPPEVVKVCAVQTECVGGFASTPKGVFRITFGAGTNFENMTVGVVSILSGEIPVTELKTPSDAGHLDGKSWGEVGIEYLRQFVTKKE